MCLILDTSLSQNMIEGESDSSCVNPWSISVVKKILQNMNAQISEYKGYHASSKCYSGAVALSSLQKSSRNKVIEMGGDTYQITGCAGKGGFAQVYKACVNSKKDEVVALKIQKPPFPWEFYMYRQLDLRIPENERSCFGYAHRLHLYSDYSIIVTNFLAHKTLLDAINSCGVTQGSMDEVLCIYYTIEMLSMLETLHRNGIIHGDFKPDNLLIRHARDDLTEDGFRDRSGSWRQQGLCLVDWGRGIDLEQFPKKIKFNGDCRTSGFRCIQMQENKPWTYQVDTYGLCGIVHVMLHNDWMEVEKKTTFDGGYSFQPKLPFKRNAQPIGRLKKAHTNFLERMCLILDTSLSQNMGYHASSKCYSGAVALSSLQKSSRNKVIEMGGDTYQITGCAGKGGFAQVYKACVNSKKDEVVALKIQKPPFPWEFYMYRQLDLRIPENERSCFGYAHRLHLYSDYSIIVTNFLAHKTLLDAINSCGVTQGSMDEVLCIYYTIEMLSMLETLHRNGIIHGDFKPDNLLIRHARDDLTEDGFRDRSGSWRQQGLCLVDWGRGIDLEQFPKKIKFNGDCRTSGFRCIQMQENKPWTYQVDTYGLCGIVHVMLHNDWMEVEKKTTFDGGYSFQPKLPFKRYQKVELWKKLFADLLNNDIHEEDEHLKMLGNLRSSFQDYMCSTPHLIKQLKQSLAKQRISLGSS
ncbi:ATP binding,protein serine/threonine kinase [Artemisia annua]|uniref:ATP binding,protein serine/threonine kinase n=1 Tax=Artemisia annua TaxID=35608 RepID=A0A2U1KSS6_ARTAN|nr:ATP binding,protein serine/threonine kinase [Artemisia annua]